MPQKNQVFKVLVMGVALTATQHYAGAVTYTNPVPTYGFAENYNFRNSASLTSEYDVPKSEEIVSVSNRRIFNVELEIVSMKKHLPKFDVDDFVEEI